MKRIINKLLSVILVLTMLVTVGSIGTLIAEASANHSQAEAVEWIKARGNEGWWEDVDGAYGCQCVDLIMKYYRYLVGYNVGGNAKDYAWNSLPSGWYRDNNPTPGCVYYSTSGEYGHIGLVYAVSGSTLYTVETNTGSPYDGGSNSFARFHTRTTANASGYIHPDFPTPHSHSYGAWQTVKAATCTAAGSKKRVCSCGDTQTETIPATGHKWNNGVVTTQPTCENKGVKTYTCSSCNTTRTEDVAALGHAYEAVTVPATCTEAAYTRFTCSRCNDTYTEVLEGWSEWSTVEPPANAENIQQKTQYRFRTKETSTGTDPEKDGWTTDGETWKQTSSGTHVYFSRPSGFNSSAYTNYASSALSPSSTATTKRDVSPASHKSYIYWHWAFPYTYGVGTNTIIGDYYGDTYSGYPDSSTVWEAFESAGDLTEHSYSDSCVRVQGHSSYSYNWFKTEVYQQTYTDYVKQYSYYRWSDWSAWQDDSITGSSDKQVEQRTVYRYLSDDNNATGHQFGTTWKYDAESHWQECSVCGVKSESESHVFDNDKDATCNTCGYTRTVEVDPVIDPDDAHLVIGSKTARAGDTVKISFELKNAPQLKSIAVSGITYDHSALELVNGEWKITDSILSNWNSANQTAAIAFAENKDVNGCIFELTFKVKDGTEDGDYSIGCKITAKTKTTSGAEDAVAIPAQKGTVSVISVIRGDVNDDNEVTSDDAIQVLYYTLLPDIYTVNQEVDFNGDGMITSDDAVYLLYFTLLPDLYPLH